MNKQSRQGLRGSIGGYAYSRCKSCKNVETICDDFMKKLLLRATRRDDAKRAKYMEWIKELENNPVPYIKIIQRKIHRFSEKH